MGTDRGTAPPQHNGFATIGLIGKRRDARIAETLAQVCDALLARGRTVLIDEQSAEHLPGCACDAVSRETLAERCDLAVVVGGDGTLLDAARSLAPAGVPILGVNQGRLGFMVDIAPSDFAARLDGVLRGEYSVDRRMLLTARIESAQGPRGPFLAVNDAVLRNQVSIRMLEFETSLDGAIVSRHRADGMIVATPTGSTAYALSGGGPVVHPSVDAFVLVPICPHTLTDRPIVVGDESAVRLRLIGPAQGAAATFDGQIIEPLMPGDEVVFGRAPYRLELIHPAGYNYFAILRDKLNWGHDPASALARA